MFNRPTHHVERWHLATCQWINQDWPKSVPDTAHQNGNEQWPWYDLLVTQIWQESTAHVPSYDTVNPNDRVWCGPDLGQCVMWPIFGVDMGRKYGGADTVIVGQALGVEPIVGWCVWGGVYLHLPSTVVTWGPAYKPARRQKWEVRARKGRRAWGPVLSIPGPASLGAWRFNTGCTCVPVTEGKLRF